VPRSCPFGDIVYRQRLLTGRRNGPKLERQLSCTPPIPTEGCDAQIRFRLARSWRRVWRGYSGCQHQSVPVALARGTSNTPVFEAGVADRRAYEEWFASLTGDFQRGATYWVGQRSLPKPGSYYIAGRSAGQKGALLRNNDSPTAITDARLSLTTARDGMLIHMLLQHPLPRPEHNRRVKQRASLSKIFQLPPCIAGQLRMPDFLGRDRNYATYRTRIAEGIKVGPNFAGRYAFIEIGCGTGCRFAFVADVSTEFMVSLAVQRKILTLT
jgi:hypothetical protein